MGTTAHHLDRARFYLRLAGQDIDDEQCLNAAHCLRRATTHAASSVLAAEGRRTGRRRRQRYALADLVASGLIPHGHLPTFHRVHELPGLVDSTSSDHARRTLRTMRLRVKRLVRDIVKVIEDCYERQSFEQPDIPRLLSNRPTLQEMHTTVPARCNNLALPPVRPPNLRLAYNPDVCPKCANLPLRSG